MINSLINKVKVIASGWDEYIPPSANNTELKNFITRVYASYSITFPDQYINFLQVVNGFEFNGLIIYGTKNSDIDPDASSLDFFEMNEILYDSLKKSNLDVVAIGEDSTGILTYDKKNNQFQYRDRIGLDRIEPFSSFEELLKVEIDKVI